MEIFSNIRVRGAIFAIFAALFLSIMVSLARGLNPEIPTSMLVFVRSCFGFLFFIPFLLKHNLEIFRTSKLYLHMVRACLSVTAMLCTYYTYRHLPLAFATSIGMSGALFITTLSSIILREKIGTSRWILVIIGYVGVIIVIRPDSYSLDYAIITSLLANLFMALALIVAKILSRTDSNITMMLYTNMGIVIVSFMTLQGDLSILSINDIITLSIIGLMGVSAQYIMLSALRMTSPSFIAPFEYTRIIFSTAIGFICFAEIPDIWIFIGSIVIIFATYSLTYLDARKENKKKSPL